MKILLMSASYHPVLGGLQTVTRHLARGFADLGHDVRVVTNRYPRTLAANEVIDGVQVDRWPFLNSSVDAVQNYRLDLAFAGAFYRPTTLWRLNRVITSFKPDVVNLHFPEARFASVLKAVRRYPVPLVVSVHGNDIEQWLSGDTAKQKPAYLVKLRALLRSANAVTACSRYLLDRATELEPSVAHIGTVVHNGVDPLRFRHPSAFFHGRPYVLAYGRYTHKKGFDLLLHAFAAVAPQVTELDLILAGSGPEQNTLTALVSSLGLDRRVFFRGQANPEEVVQLLKGCRLAVIPSREEPFGIVALEMLYTGCPMVITRVGGLLEVVEAAARSGKIPVIEWAQPEPRDLARAITRVLELPASLPSMTPESPCLTLDDMVRGYLNVLEKVACVVKSPSDFLQSA